MENLKYKKAALLVGLVFVGSLFLTKVYPSATWTAKGNEWIFQYKPALNYPTVVTTNGNKYFVGSDHKKKEGFQNIDGKTYYFDKWVGMRTNWFQVEDDWYFFHPETGEMAKGFTEINHHWFYFFNDGKMLKEDRQIGDEKVIVAPSGGIVNADKLKQIKGGNNE